MLRKIWLVAISVILLLCMAAPAVYAQSENGTRSVDAPVTFGWIVLAWLIYSFAGFFASGENWNGVKFARTFLVTIIVAFIALVLQISPSNVVTQFGGVIDVIATIIMNTGPGITLIYLLEKLLKIVAAWKAKWEKARELAPAEPGPPPPKPTA